MIRLALAVISLSLLASCGLKEGLERPAPMWGDARDEFRREQAEQEAAAERARQQRALEEQPQQPAEPVQTTPPPPPTSAQPDLD